MSGPITKHRTAIGWLEGVVIFGGALVIVGLVEESGPELWQAILTWTWPGRGPIGSAIIAIGVALEVGLGIFLTLDAKRAEREAKERIALAERATAEADLARVQTERRLVRLTVSRHLADEEIEALQERLKPFAGQPFAITVAPTDDAATIEPVFFASQVREVLQGAGWTEENIPMTQRVGRGVLIEFNAGHQRAGFRLQKALSEIGIQAKASWTENTRNCPKYESTLGYCDLADPSRRPTGYSKPPGTPSILAPLP